MQFVVEDLSAYASAFISYKQSLFATITFLAYTHITSIDDEVEFVWKSRLSLGKVLYIFNRFFGLTALITNCAIAFIPNLSDNFCFGYYWWLGLSQIIAILNAELILQTRIYAVYDCSQKLLITLCLLYATEAVSAIVLLGKTVALNDFRAIHGLTGCHIIDRQEYISFYWIPTVVFEMILCGLISYKAFMMHKYQYAIPTWRTISSQASSSLFVVIVRENVFCFIMIFAALLANFLFSSSATPQLAQVATGWSIAIPCACSSRLLLKMHRRHLGSSVETSTYTYHDMSFANIPNRIGETKASKAFAQKKSSQSSVSISDSTC